jgi:hypothetical protein
VLHTLDEGFVTLYLIYFLQKRKKVQTFSFYRIESPCNERKNFLKSAYKYERERVQNFVFIKKKIRKNSDASSWLPSNLIPFVASIA